MQTFRTLIEDIGTARLAGLFGTEESHVRTMKARNSVPAEYWGLLIEEKPDLTFGKLRQMRGKRFLKDDHPAEVGAA